MTASPSYDGPPLVNAGRIYYRVYVHLVLRCRGKSNNFTLGELAIVRFRLVCLSHIARITLALLRTKSNMGIRRTRKNQRSNFSTEVYQIPSELIDIFSNRRGMSFLSFLLSSTAIQL